MRLKRDSLIWSAEPSRETVSLDQAAEGVEEPEASRIREVIANRLAGGDLWAWCAVRVRCCLPGCLYLPGEATVRCGTFGSQEEFMAGDTYAALADAALADLERKVMDIAKAWKSCAEGGDENRDASVQRPAEPVVGTEP